MENRIIKFRAWDKKYNKMRGLDGVPDLFSLRSDGDCSVNFILMQFTGLKDKNGTEIFEGDVISSKFSDGKNCNHIIEQVESGFGARFISTFNDKASLFTQSWLIEFEKEIIGNVYENPELLY